MGTAQKFLFEDCFDPTIQVEEEEVVEEIVPPPPTFSEEEIAAAHTKGFVEGRAEGIAEMGAGLDQRITDILERITGQLDGISAQHAEFTRAAEHRMLSLTSAIARKVVPEIAREHADAAIGELIRECLPKLMDEPRIVVRVHAAQMEELRDKMDVLAAKGGFAGDIILLADDELAEADCRVEWADGGAERNASDTWAEIQKSIDSHLTRLAPDTPGQPDADEPPTPTGNAPDGMDAPEYAEENLNG